MRKLFRYAFIIFYLKFFNFSTSIVRSLPRVRRCSHPHLLATIKYMQGQCQRKIRKNVVVFSNRCFSQWIFQKQHISLAWLALASLSRGKLLSGDSGHVRNGTCSHTSTCRCSVFVWFITHKLIIDNFNTFGATEYCNSQHIGYMFDDLGGIQVGLWK